jgi:LysR family transcriptional regulator, transcriptional activator of nhaA
MKGIIMASLNFKHLRYFWMVAKTGSIIRASEQLFLSPQSISGQLGEFELSLGVQLFQKKGRGLEPTEMGRRLLTYADEIFTLGDELLNEVHNQTVKKSTPFRIGVSDTVAKSVAYRVIAPVLQLDDTFRLFCNEGKLASLLAELSVNQLDLVIADRPMPANLNVRAFNYLVGESKLAIFASPALTAKHGKMGFPAMLNNAPYLMAGEDFAYKKRLISWFEAKQIYPNVVAEFDDSALLKYFGQAGAGFFAAPSAIADYICKQYDVEKVGDIETVMDELYVITTERRLTHPAIVAIVDATAKIFA